MMRKLFLNLLIGLITFLVGVCIQNTLKVKQIFTKNFAVQTNKSVEVSNSYATPLQFDEKEEVATFDDEGFSGGWYMVDDFKGMKEVWTILLSRNDDFSENKEIVWSAIILTDKEENHFQSISIKTGENKLKFKTNKVRDVNYKFEGNFLKNGRFAVEGEEVLKGNLQKYVKGRKVAEIKAIFAYHEPRCWH